MILIQWLLEAHWGLSGSVRLFKKGPRIGKEEMGQSFRKVLGLMGQGFMDLLTELWRGLLQQGW